MSRSLASCSFLALILLAAPLQAQDTDPAEAANAELKQLIAGWLEDFRLGTQYARQQFAYDFNEMVKEMAEVGFDIDQVEEVSEALEEFQSMMYGSLAPVLEGCADSASGILGQYWEVLAPMGSPPVEFSVGAASTWDAFHTAVRKEVDRSYAAVRKRLLKYRKKLALEGVNFAFLLEAPELPDAIVNPGESTNGDLQRTGLDWILAFSRADESGDGRLRLGGACAGNVTLEVLGAEAETLEGIEPEFGGDRWVVELGNWPDGKPEGSYLFRISPEGATPTDTEQITLR